MQAPSAGRINMEYRSLPPGWVAHYDQQYYVNLNATPPVASFVHPYDQYGRTSNNQISRPPTDAVPNAPMSGHQVQDHTRSVQIIPPFVAVTEAQGAQGPTFAQKLYASSLPTSLSYPTNATSRPSSSLGRSPEANLYATPPSSPIAGFLVPSPTSSSVVPAHSSSEPLRASPSVLHGSSRKPRGARSPNFPRTSFSVVDRTSVSESADEFGVRTISQNRQTLDSTRQLNNRPYSTELDTHQHRSVTVPTFVYSTTSTAQNPTRNAQSKKVTDHKITICSPNPLQVSTKITTPAFQVFTGTQSIQSSSSEISHVPSVAPSTKPVLAPIIIPNSSSLASRPHNDGTIIPTGADLPFRNQQVAYLPSTQNSMFWTSNHSQSVARSSTPPGQPGSRIVQNGKNPNANHKLLKKVGMAVGKSVGKATLRLGTKVALENMDSSANIDNSLMDAINTDIPEVAFTAASHAIASADNLAIDSSFDTGVCPPSSSTQFSPEYTAILQQMESMGLNQPVAPRQSSLDSSEVTNILATMHAMQVRHN
ncbi:hypothetical protein JR316_0000779 [Psilocybe cubensis]|uniref:Uncharacterized protein n=2 Tax=Psilocybe cubensis TaxID=181762 RepID=A0ACB8HFV3_PSICU|nr:hypothetical protein JR316_0000779 [Psilocybe cubensis]KAH9486714.1 hypothetical protein JR316_0000779 [Psilocybe cubensis]